MPHNKVNKGILLTPKKFEIFSGTGGVGKTTLATSRAIEIARSGKRVLLITIDPAKRLKELMRISSENSGDVVHIQDPFEMDEQLNLYVELMNPEETFKRVAKQNDCQEILTNRILTILTRPFGGLNEILSLVELDIQQRSGNFDTIVLDTPPGSHFLDFLESAEKIKLFFDSSFIEIFSYLGKKMNNTPVKVGKRMMNFVVGAGVKKLLGYLNKVTGDKFVNDFIEAIIAIYKTKGSFLSALTLQDELKQDDFSNWYLVTSVEQNKIAEALELQAHAVDFISAKTTVLINKCLQDSLTDWKPEPSSLEAELKESLISRESTMVGELQKHFENTLCFPEIIELDPMEHVRKLINHWNPKR